MKGSSAPQLLAHFSILSKSIAVRPFCQCIWFPTRCLMLLRVVDISLNANAEYTGLLGEIFSSDMTWERLWSILRAENGVDHVCSFESSRKNYFTLSVVLTGKLSFILPEDIWTVLLSSSLLIIPMQEMIEREICQSCRHPHFLNIIGILGPKFIPNCWKNVWQLWNFQPRWKLYRP